jgi:hypothetical protein
MKNALTTVLALLAGFFAALYFFSPRTVETVKEVTKEKPVEVVLTNTVERWLTNEVEKWRTNEVEVVRNVEVPAKLNEGQQFAVEFFARSLVAQVLTNEEALYKLPSFDVRVGINDNVRRIVSEDEIKTKFELTLRSHGIKISEESLPTVWFTVEGIWNDSLNVLSYSLRLRLTEPATVMREGEIWRVLADTYSEGAYGYAGRNVGKGALLDAAQQYAEIFVNKYLKAKERQDAIHSKLVRLPLPTEGTPSTEPTIKVFDR